MEKWKVTKGSAAWRGLSLLAHRFSLAMVGGDERKGDGSSGTASYRQAAEEPMVMHSDVLAAAA